MSHFEAGPESGVDYDCQEPGPWGDFSLSEETEPATSVAAVPKLGEESRPLGRLFQRRHRHTQYRPIERFGCEERRNVSKKFLVVLQVILLQLLNACDNDW